MSHTSGSWLVVDSPTTNDLLIYAAADETCIARVPIANRRGYATPEEVANARLMAASPDLLEALLAAKAFGSQGETDEGISVSYLVESAIAKGVATACHLCGEHCQDTARSVQEVS